MNQMFEDLVEIFEEMNDETINQMLEEMEPKKFDVEEYLNSNYDY
jgi:Mg/Co/Ni transporter MgtE|tara:strand:- start:285 stop:419 length:135 start_codon:yes stop_codon:yes gene_type:complete